MTISLPKCPKTGKKSFLDEASTMEFEERNRAQYQILHQYAYACEDCNAWHLSTSPPGNNSMAQTKYEPGVSVKKGVNIDEVVRMRKEGKSVQEIADTFGVSLAGIKYHLDKADGKLTTKTNRPAAPQLITYEQHRDRRIELEAELVQKKRQHHEAEALIQTQIDRIKQIEDRLFEERQLKIDRGPNGAVVLKKYNREFDLTREDLAKLLEEVKAA